MAARWQREGEEAFRDSLERVLLEVAIAAESGVDLDRLKSDLPGEIALRRRVLEQLRSELLALPEGEGGSEGGMGTDGGGCRELVDLLRGIERVRTVLEPDWRHEFMSGLLGPNGLELAAGVSHDLRSPLTSILFLSDSLRTSESAELNEVQRRQVGLIHSAARSMVSMVSDVIGSCLHGAASGEGEVVCFTLDQLLASVQDIMVPIAEQKDLAVEVSWDGPDPRRGRPVAITRVLLNLAHNALKFTEEGFVRIVAREIGTGSVNFSVEDSGPGIPERVRARLYQSFRLMDGQEGLRFSASGLGLSVARTLLDSMGSRLMLRTGTGQGTTFSFTLDLPRAEGVEPTGSGPGYDETCARAQTRATLWK